MSSDDWFRRKRVRLPFFDIDLPSFYSGDVEEMLRELEKRMDEAFRDLSQRAPEKLTRERRLEDGRIIREMGPFVYGYSVTIGPDGRPVIREFGNVKPSRTRPGLDVKEDREPLVDVMPADGEVKVIAELPGIEKQDIKLSATETTLSISAETPERRYSKEVELPSEVEPETAKSTYKNGVLEVTIQKKKEKKARGLQIKID